MDTWQVPLEFVVQLVLPVAPFDQLPFTVALGIGFSVESWTKMATVAFQLLLNLWEAPSRSPMCSVITAGVEVGVGVSVAVGKGVGVSVGVAVGKGVGVGVTRLPAASQL